MKTLKILVFIFALFSCVLLKAQDPLYPSWTASETAAANTAAGAGYLTEEEKRVIYLMNLARLDGKKFRDTYAKGYFIGPTNSYRQSLYADLVKIKDLPMLVPVESLCRAAKSHAVETGKQGTFGHKSENGHRPAERIERFGYGSFTAVAENCSYGYPDALGIVMQLLADDGVPMVGHRKNILNPRFKAVGVSIQPHKVMRFTCVQDFGDIMPGEAGTE